VIARRPHRLTQCPVYRRALLLLLAVALSSCVSAYPEPVEGLPDAGSWTALPLRSWLAEDRAEPEAVAICRPPDCGPRMVVGVVRLHGEDADQAEAILRDPDHLARALEEMRGHKSKVRTIATARRLAEGPSQGFVLFLGRDDGERAVHGAALGRRDADGLRVVLAIGENAEAVEATARRVAARHLGS
jgi:hypothetical protein